MFELVERIGKYEIVSIRDEPRYAGVGHAAALRPLRPCMEMLSDV